MAERQDEILVKGVMQAEQDLAMMVPPMHGFARHVLERVVHEAHVPLEAEAQPAVMRGGRDARPRGGLLGDGEDAGMLAVNLRLTWRRNSTASQFSRRPARWAPTRRPCGCNRVRASRRPHPRDAVDMITLGPEQRVVDQEARHLAPPEIIDGGVPVGVETLARVLMLVERGAVEMRQAMRVGGKCAGTSRG